MGAVNAGKGALLAIVSKDLGGISAAELISAAARMLGGGGSKDPEMAQAGGPRGERLGEALDEATEAARRALTGG